MSDSNLGKFLSKVLIPDLNASVEKGAKSARRTLTSKDETTHQFFIVKKSVFLTELDHIANSVNEMKNLSSSNRVNLDGPQKVSLWKKYLRRLNKEETAAKKSTRGKLLHSRKWMLKSGQMPTKKPVLPTDLIFVIRDFRKVKEIKQELGKDFLEEIKTNLKHPTDRRRDKQLTPKQQDQIRYKVTGAGQTEYGYQHGHGEYGEAASELRIARAQALVSGYKGTPEEKEVLERLVSVDFQEDNEHKLDHKLIFEVLPNGELKLKDDYMTFLSLQLTGDNQEDSVAEQRAVDAVQANAEKLLFTEGSTKITDAIAMVFMTALVNKTKKVPKVKVTFPGKQPKRKIKEKGLGRSANKLKMVAGFAIGQSGIHTKAVTGKISKKVGNRGTNVNKTASRGGMSPISLITLINSKLPKQVISNMGAPALENRTGRFASSAVVTNVLPSKMGSVIQYTYQRNPYQVFEGGPKSDGGNRDPRTLIDLSIREIAAQTMVGKFTTQRV